MMMNDDELDDDDHSYPEPSPLHCGCDGGVDPGKPHVEAGRIIPCLAAEDQDQEIRMRMKGWGPFQSLLLEYQM